MTMTETKENVGVGWHPIVERLERVLNTVAPDYKVEQIKEKFGGLRYYVSFPEGTPDDAAWAANAAIAAAERDCGRTCEVCGQPGRTEPVGSWIRTLCNKHRAKAWAWWSLPLEKQAAAREEMFSDDPQP